MVIEHRSDKLLSKPVYSYDNQLPDHTQSKCKLLLKYLYHTFINHNDTVVVDI